MVRALVMRAPGINCDRETGYACQLAGFETELVHINELVREPGRLLQYDFLVIPGGFSYGDDLGAGTLLAKHLTVHLEKQLQQFIDEGRPALGICNGFQTLVRAGLLPGWSDGMRGRGGATGAHAPLIERVGSAAALASLTGNASAQFECRWVRLAVGAGACIFTQGIEGTIELPVAHGEGQFLVARRETLAQLVAGGQAPLLYAGDARSHGEGNELAYPANPNGSMGNIAGVCNARGNVLGMMPHPERYVRALQHPQRRERDGGEGDGLLLFKNAYAYATRLQERKMSGPERVGAREDVTWGKGLYATSGVNIAAADKAKGWMKEAVRATHGPQVLAGMGAFAGVFSANSLQRMQQPALVASTDGVGTKTLIAAQTGRFEDIGYDLVHHSVNDLLTQGARPLFFMDYLAMGKLEPRAAAAIVKSVAAACKEVGCALLGGETAEMPDVYLPGAFDLAGTIVGVVEQDEIVDGHSIGPGDILLGLPSNGLHTNGYSLARKVFAEYDLHTLFPELGDLLVNALLRPHRCYLREVERLHPYLADRNQVIKGMAHITGGGFPGNISRILPAGTRAVIETRRWSMPPLFQIIARLGKVSQEEMYATFNMGVGMVFVFSSKGAIDARCVLPELLPVGYITEGEGVVLH